MRRVDARSAPTATAQVGAYFAKDHLGSVVAVFDSNGATTVRYSYTPYGELRSQSSSTSDADNDMRYIGGLQVGNLYKLGARYYDPSIGRFTQVDPSGQEKNPYAYAGCNPINAKDPSGLFSDCVYQALNIVLDFAGILIEAGFTVAAFAPTLGGDAIVGLAAIALTIAKADLDYTYWYDNCI